MNNPKICSTFPWIYLFSACGVVTICDVGLYSPLNRTLERLTNSILIASPKIADGFNCIQLKKKKTPYIHYHFGLFAYQHVKWGLDRENWPHLWIYAHIFPYLTFNLLYLNIYRMLVSDMQINIKTSICQYTHNKFAHTHVTHKWIYVCKVRHLFAVIESEKL